MKLDPVKLAHLARGIDSMAERIDYWTSERMPAPLVVRRADKQWDESKHPRGPDGKFIEGEGAAAASAAEYLAQQAKAGKKATPNGMMQHMLLNGGITKQEIWETTKANFEMSPSLNNYVSAVAATMKKKGIDVPEPPKAKKGGDKPAAEKKEDKPKADPGAEDAPAETEQSKKEAAAFGKAIDATTVATDISEHALDIKYAADKGLITAEQHDALKKKMQAKATELAGQATLPKPQNVHQDDIHWMATKSSYPPGGKGAIHRRDEGLAAKPGIQGSGAGPARCEAKHPSRPGGDAARAWRIPTPADDAPDSVRPERVSGRKDGAAEGGVEARQGHVEQGLRAGADECRQRRQCA